MSNQIGEALNNLITDLESKKKPSKKQQIEDHFTLINDAKNAGASMPIIAQLLRENGVDITERYLANILYRIRKERGETKKINRVKGKMAVKTKEIIKPLKVKEYKWESVHNPTPEAERLAKPYTDKFNEYKKLKDLKASPEEQYTFLGGDVNDLITLTELQKRRACVALSCKLLDEIERIETLIR